MKKIIAILMAGVLLMSFASFVNAEETAMMDLEAEAYEQDISQSNEPTTKELENIIKIVKPKLDVPEECIKFDWNYNSATYYNQASWYLAWRNDDFSKEINVSCDTKGNILSYSYYENSKNKAMEVPVYSKEALKGTAMAFLEKLAPDCAPDMRLESAVASSLYSKSYVYNFVRYENDIIVPDNTASVSVNYVTGKPTAMNISFNRYVTFEKKNSIDINDAKNIIADNQTMNLSYMLKTEHDDNGGIISRNAYLVYNPEASYVSVNASTGEVYTERNTWNILEKGAGSVSGGLNNMFDSVSKEEASAEQGEYRLSEEELAQLDVLNLLITREEAIKIVTENEYLFIDSDATAVDAQLVQSYGAERYSSKIAPSKSDNDEYKWNITFTAPYNESEEKKYFNPFMKAVVDAQTGTIISFRANLPGYDYYEAMELTENIPELKVSKEKAGEIFNQFAASVIPEYAKNTRLSSNDDAVIYKYIKENEKSIPVFREASINLVRVNEGIDFTYNNISGAVDRVTGKITRFNYKWHDDVVFESPEDAISAKEAYMALLNSDGFGLNYEINSEYTYHKYLQDNKNGYIDYDKLYTSEQYTRQVYSGYNYISTTVSALTGELLDYSGEPAKRVTDIVYTDISGHWAEKEINILSDLGFSFDGEEFRPDSFITFSDFEKLMNFFHLYLNKTELKEADKALTLTRTQGVKHLIDSAGYYKIASMPDIFITDFADNSELKYEDLGFIAIARGFGIIQGNLGKFRPYDNLTRAEAVALMINYIDKIN